MLFGVTPRDLTTYATVVVLILAGALAACLLPARRAASVDPAVILRARDHTRHGVDVGSGDSLECASSHCGAIGTVKKKVLPLPGSLFTQIRPSCPCTMHFEMYRPNPTPRRSGLVS